jgi:hypothetical protein
MSHPLTALLGIACLVSLVPLAAHATDDTVLSAPNPLLSAQGLAPGNFSVLRVKSGLNRSGAHMAPVIYGPDFVPKWQMRALSHGAGASKLKGERFEFR